VRRMRSSQAFTLVEILLASALLLILMAPLITLFVQTIRICCQIEVVCDLQSQAIRVIDVLRREIEKSRGLCLVRGEGDTPMAGVLQPDQTIVTFSRSARGEVLATSRNETGGVIGKPRIVARCVDQLMIVPVGPGVQIWVSVSGFVADKPRSILLSTTVVPRGW